MCPIPSQYQPDFGKYRTVLAKTKTFFEKYSVRHGRSFISWLDAENQFKTPAFIDGRTSFRGSSFCSSVSSGATCSRS
jgi:hypothetical protein